MPLVFRHWPTALSAALVAAAMARSAADLAPVHGQVAGPGATRRPVELPPSVAERWDVDAPGPATPPTPARTVPASELSVRRSVPVEFPAGAGFDSARCIAVVDLDARGVPTVRSVVHCPRPFAEATRAGLAEWRWEPPVDAPVRTEMAILFRLSGADPR